MTRTWTKTRKSWSSPPRLSECVRFFNKVQAEVTRGERECWEWTGGKRSDGYGSLVNSSAHRFAYELAHGPIPAGLVIDHLCRNHICVNPAHLEAVTNRENILRGVGATARNARKTHCLRGHAFTEDNLDPYYVKKGGRSCLTCKRERNRKWMRRYKRGEP